MSYLLGIDQGTSGTKALLVDVEGRVCAYAYRAVERLHPRPDWVEQEPDAVAAGVAGAVADVLQQTACHPRDILACGLTCQRNTAFAWDAASGRPLGNAITWQDLRTLPLLRQLQDWPAHGEIHRRLGYGPGPYMAALHLGWRMLHDPPFAAAARDGSLRLGLSAAWLLRALGRPSAHQMDASLVQAIGLYDFRAGRYWPEWLQRLGVPAASLPAAVPTLADFGGLHVESAGGSAEVPVLAMIGDQQAALFGHDCRRPGDAECTHGTASYVKLFLGSQIPAPGRVDQYFAWDLGHAPTYCLEAPTTVVGAVLRWMRDQLGLLADYGEIEQLAGSVEDAAGLVFVPALTGLNAPYYDPNTRGSLFGLTLGHQRAHIVRAFLEAIAYQVRHILDTIGEEAGVRVEQLLVGGGVSASDVACQVQADLLGMPVRRPSFTETTAWAAALLAGLAAGVWPSPEALPPLPGDYSYFTPRLSAARRDEGYARWQQAIALARQWPAGLGRQDEEEGP